MKLQILIPKRRALGSLCLILAKFLGGSTEKRNQSLASHRVEKTEFTV